MSTGGESISTHPSWAYSNDFLCYTAVAPRTCTEHTQGSLSHALRVLAVTSRQPGQAQGLHCAFLLGLRLWPVAHTPHKIPIVLGDTPSTNSSHRRPTSLLKTEPVFTPPAAAGWVAFQGIFTFPCGLISDALEESVTCGSRSKSRKRSVRVDYYQCKRKRS